MSSTASSATRRGPMARRWTYYASGTPVDWQSTYISGYATRICGGLLPRPGRII